MPREIVTWPQTKLVVLCGPPCSGKSTLARPLGMRFGLFYLHIDHVLSELIPGSKRIKKDRELAYRATHMIARALLNSANSVLIEATYGSTQNRADIETLSRETGTALYVIELQIDPDDAVMRFQSRTNHPAIDLTDERVRRLAETYRYSKLGLLLPASTPTDSAMAQIDEYLSRSSPLPADGTWSAGAVGYTS